MLTVTSLIGFGAYNSGAAAPVLSNLYAWGDNNRGQQSSNNTTDKSSPVIIGTSSDDWAMVAAGTGHFMGIKADGTLWACGSNAAGQLGMGDTTDRSSMVQVGALTDWAWVTAAGDATTGFTCAIKTDGTLWTWGDNDVGQLGSGSTTDRSSPVQVGALTDWSKVYCMSTGAGGDGFTCAIKTNGGLWTWGDGASGKLASGATTDRSSPVRVGTLTNWAELALGVTHVVARKTDGTLWAWGANNAGQLGTNNVTNRSSPVQVGTDTDWLHVAAGGATTAGFSMATKTNGTLYSWGDGAGGKKMSSAVTDTSVPTQVGALTDWLSPVAAGGGASGFSFCIKTDNTLWSAGKNGAGQLGNNATGADISSPVQIGTGFTFIDCNGGDGDGWAVGLKNSA